MSQLDSNTRRRITERALVRALIGGLRNCGFEPWRTYDGEVYVYGDEDKLVASVFNLDEVSLRFVPADLLRAHREGDKRACARALDGIEHGVLLILGEGIDSINDWNFRDGDADGFNRAMEEVTEKIYDEVSDDLGALRQCDQIAIMAGPWLPGKPLPVMFIGEERRVRVLGECRDISEVDRLLSAHLLTAERVSHVRVDEGGWAKEVYVAHA